MAEQPFGERLRRRIEATSPLCVGLDPSPKLLAQWGLPDSAAGVEAMSRATIDAVSDVAAAVKPQVAYFERHGSAGIAALERVFQAARQAEIMVVADAKRGDIDATMTAYGQAWLADTSPLAADALTVTAYLGLGAMAEVVELARATGRGLFCVVASSNPEGRSLQEATTESGARVEAALLGELAALNAQEVAAGASIGSFGAVVGATRAAGTLALGHLNGPFLVPGVGAQGATPRDVGALFADVPSHSVLVNASRSILAEGPDLSAVRAAADALSAELRTALS